MADTYEATHHERDEKNPVFFLATQKGDTYMFTIAQLTAHCTDKFMTDEDIEGIEGGKDGASWWASTPTDKPLTMRRTKVKIGAPIIKGRAVLGQEYIFTPSNMGQVVIQAREA